MYNMFCQFLKCGDRINLQLLYWGTFRLLLSSYHLTLTGNYWHVTLTNAKQLSGLFSNVGFQCHGLFLKVAVWLFSSVAVLIDAHLFISVNPQVTDVSLTGDRANACQACVVMEERAGSCQGGASAVSALQEATSVHTAPSPPDPSHPNPSSCSGASGRDFTSPSL